MSDAELDVEALSGLSGRWRAAWAGADRSLLGELCTPDVQYEDPVAPEPLHGLEALVLHTEGLRRTFPDLRLEPTGAPLGDGRYACLPWRALATQRGPIADLPAGGRRLALHGLHYVELTDGRVRRARGFFDLHDAGAQLGLVPRRGSFGERAMLMLRGFGLRAD